jgi:hypothetical protein
MPIFFFYIYTDNIFIIKCKKMVIRFLKDNNTIMIDDISNIINEYFGIHCLQMFINHTHKFLADLKLFNYLKDKTQLPINIIYNIIRFSSEYIMDEDDVVRYFNHPFNLQCISDNNYNIPAFCFVGFTKKINNENNNLENAFNNLNKYYKTCIVNNDKYVLYYIHKYDNKVCIDFDYNDIMNEENPYYQFYKCLLQYIDLYSDKIIGKFVLSSCTNSFQNNGKINNNIILYTYRYGLGSIESIDTMTNM